MVSAASPQIRNTVPGERNTVPGIDNTVAGKGRQAVAALRNSLGLTPRTRLNAALNPNGSP